jgi:hypothetical protein
MTFQRPSDRFPRCAYCEREVKITPLTYCPNCNADLRGELLETPIHADLQSGALRTLPDVLGRHVNTYVGVGLLGAKDPLVVRLVKVGTDHFTVSFNRRVWHIPYRTVDRVEEPTEGAFVFRKLMYCCAIGLNVATSQAPGVDLRDVAGILSWAESR